MRSRLNFSPVSGQVINPSASGTPIALSEKTCPFGRAIALERPPPEIISPEIRQMTCDESFLLKGRQSANLNRSGSVHNGQRLTAASGRHWGVFRMARPASKYICRIDLNGSVPKHWQAAALKRAPRTFHFSRVWVSLGGFSGQASKVIALRIAVDSIGESVPRAGKYSWAYSRACSLSSILRNSSIRSKSSIPSWHGK